MDKKLKSSKQVVLICLVIIIAFSASAIMFTISSFKNKTAWKARYRLHGQWPATLL